MSKRKKGKEVVEFFEFLGEEFGIKLVYKKRTSRKTGKVTKIRDILFYTPETYPKGKRGKFIYDLEGVRLRDVFPRDKKTGKIKIPSKYEDIKRKIYEALPQFFRTLYQFNYYAKEPNKDTPKPFAEFIVFAYNKQPMAYSKDAFEEIEIHLRELSAIDRREKSALELDAQHFNRWKSSIAWDFCTAGFEQDRVLTPSDMKNEGEKLSGLANVELNGVGGFKALNYVHRLTVYLDKRSYRKLKGVYRENYWQNAELDYLEDLDEKLHHIKGHLINVSIPRIDYKPRYRLKYGVEWE
jgi:hypothetical protein